MDLIWQIHYGVATVPESTIGALRCSIGFLSEKEDARQEDCHPPRHTTGVSVCHCFISLLPKKTVEKSTEKRGGFHSENVGLVDGRVFLARGSVLSWKSICLACTKHWVQTLTSHQTKTNWSRAHYNTSSWETETGQSDVQGALSQLRLCEKLSWSGGDILELETLGTWD